MEVVQRVIVGFPRLKIFKINISKCLISNIVIVLLNIR